MNVEHIPAKDVDMLPCGADWQSRHLESEKRKAEIRDRIHKQAEQGQKTAKDYFRPAKPTPSIYDSDLKRVAVYARVSTSSEEQISSIENQTLYYTKKIAETENWNLQDIYSDEGKSGTSLRKRDAFKRMMRDAKDQKMDLIICASISRFARNFSDCMTQIFRLMNWNRECRYKVLGRVANSDQGLCMLFDLEEAIMFTPKPQEYTDPLTGEMKKKQMKFFPDAYKNRIGKSYNDYIADHQMNMFEDFIGYKSSTVLDEPEREAGTTSIPIPQREESENIPLPDLPGQLENVQQSGNEIAKRGMPT